MSFSQDDELSNADPDLKIAWSLWVLVGFDRRRDVTNGETRAVSCTNNTCRKIDNINRFCTPPPPPIESSRHLWSPSIGHHNRMTPTTIGQIWMKVDNSERKSILPINNGHPIESFYLLWSWSIGHHNRATTTNLIDLNWAKITPVENRKCRSILVALWKTSLPHQCGHFPLSFVYFLALAREGHFGTSFYTCWSILHVSFNIGLPWFVA